MSLDIRYLTNGKTTVYVVVDKATRPFTIRRYDTRDEIPVQIRHYAPEGKPMFVGPDSARHLFAMKTLYPEFVHEFCGEPHHVGTSCIFESCNFEDWERCKYRCTRAKTLKK